MENVWTEMEKHSVSDIDTLITELTKIKEQVGNCPINVDDNCGGSYEPRLLTLLKLNDKYLVDIS